MENHCDIVDHCGKNHCDIVDHCGENHCDIVDHCGENHCDIVESHCYVLTPRGAHALVCKRGDTAAREN